MSVHEGQEWLRKRALRLGLGAVALASSGSAAVTDENAEQLANKLHEVEIAEQYRPTAKVLHAREAALEASEKAEEQKKNRDEGLEQSEKLLREADRRRPPRKRGR